MNADMAVKTSIPDTRLPFINTEISETNFHGERCLVSSIWGGVAGGRLYFWNMDASTVACRHLPHGIGGAYMLKEGPDGRLYVGCGNGSLLRYDSQVDDFDVLVDGALRSLAWSGCVTDRYVVWIASPGEGAVYDWRADKLVKVFKPIDKETPAAIYGRSTVEAPDGRIVIGMNTPCSRLIVLDLATMETLSYTPEILKSASSIHDLDFLTENLFACSSVNEILLFSYPGMELQQRIAAPAGITRVRGRLCTQTGNYYATGYPGDELLELDKAKGCFKVLAENWTGGHVGAVGTRQGRDFCAVTVSGVAFCRDGRSGITKHLDLKAVGKLSAHTLCVAPEAGMILGAPFINQRFWSIDMRTGQGRDRGRAAPGAGQVNQIVWDPLTSRFILSSYATCTLTAFDPAKESVWPDNPVVLASAAEQEQMRPMGLAHDGRYVWMATSPCYGLLGGALCRLDPLNGALDVWRNIVPEQRINALILDIGRRRVYCSSSIHADVNSAPPTATTARLVSFCMDTLAVLRSDILRENIPVLKILGLMEDGRVLVHEFDGLHTWDPETGVSRHVAPSPKSIKSVVDWTPEHGMLMSADGSISRVKVVDGKIQYKELVKADGAFLQVAGGKLWYACGYDVCCVDLT